MQVENVLRYWIGPLSGPWDVPEGRGALWFRKDPEVDETIRAQFGSLRQRAVGGELEAWKKTPRGRLAYIILLDQFSRNLFRGSARAFEADPLALSAALDGLELGEDSTLAGVERVFFYLPLEHSEDREVQDLSVDRFRLLLREAPSDKKDPFRSYLEYATRHRDIVHRFGRFPHRNAALGRPSTAEEAAFLAEPGSSF